MIDDLRISEVRIRMAHAAEGSVAWASCVVNGCLALRNIAIRRRPGDGRMVLVYPATRSRSGVKYFHFRPLDAAAKEALDRAILGGLKDMTGQ